MLCKFFWEELVNLREMQHLLHGSLATCLGQWLPAEQAPGPCLNSLRPRQNGRHFTDDIFICIFLNANVGIPIEISLKFIPQGPINNIPALVQIMAWRRPGDKPLSGPMMVRLPTHICVTRPQCVSIKTVLLRYGDSHVKDKTVTRPSYL